MIEEIRIRSLGVIDDALLPFAPGFTVVTGETGAGKTMVVTGLGLLLGARADSGAVRAGTAGAVVEGRFVLTPNSPAALRATEAGAVLDDDSGDSPSLLVARSVSAEGRSRAHVGGRSVPVAVLGELADHLVAVHGQSDQRRLLAPARQRAALDRYAGAAVAAPLADYTVRYETLRSVEAELHDVTTRSQERAREADLLGFGVQEVADVAPEPGEDAALRAEESRLAHAEVLRAAADVAHAALVGRDGDDGGRDQAADVLQLLTAGRRALEQARAHDPALGALADRSAEASYLVADLAADLASYAAGVEVDPARLAAVGERRAALTSLTRKYGPTVEDVLAWAEEAGRRLEGLTGDDERIERLRQERTHLRAELGRLAAQLSTARTAAAQRFATEVTAELAELAMPRANISVAVTQRVGPDGLAVPALPDGPAVDERLLRAGPTGVDEVEILLSSGPGLAARPLSRGASGGELSRVMLAVEAVFAGADPVPTFVFDEVDAGVGGRAAVEIGRRLAALARVAQVVVVTHLPQVAAYADRHLVVAKDEDGSVSSSGVSVLDDAGRVRELSRMLAGAEGSDTGLAHAEELLAAARSAGAAG